MKIKCGRNTQLKESPWNNTKGLTKNKVANFKEQTADERTINTFGRLQLYSAGVATPDPYGSAAAGGI